jgi:ABC-type branched-subunit amino acid transport system ATPase component
LERADDAAGNLPYGDQRRLEIARAMCTQPALLCLDEPCGRPECAGKRRLKRIAALDPRRSGHLDSPDRA